MRICVVGGGEAGLCAAKTALEAKCEVTLFEQTAQIGGMWSYTDEAHKDKNGLDVHSSIYKGFRTNFPKEIMGFPEFKIDEPTVSYISADSLLGFLKKYAEYYHLNDIIKLQHHVSRIKPINDSTWEVTVKDFVNSTTSVYIFDAVLICNGHYQKANLPDYAKSNKFTGTQIHSHSYRDPENYRNKDVLLIGAGASAYDILMAVSKVAQRVTVSTHSKTAFQFNLPPNVIIKPDVKDVNENGVLFEDNTCETFSDIIYCTGYNYNFPFLDKTCGIEVESRYIKHLFKHIVNIEHPTMMFLGMPYYVIVSHMIDIQARFCLKFLTGQRLLPSKDEMMMQTQKEMEERWARGLSKKHAHLMNHEQFQYYDDLINLADLKITLPPVYGKIFYDTIHDINNDYLNLRKNNYTILNDHEFLKSVSN